MIKSIAFRRAAFPLALALSSLTLTTIAHPLAVSSLRQQHLFSENQSQEANAQTLLAEGQEHFRAKRYDQAIEVLRRAVQLQPDSGVAHFYLGASLQETGKLNEALAAMKRAVELMPGDARSYFGLGNVQRVMRRYDEAIESYKQAITIDPNHFGTYNNLGAVYGITNRHAQAAEAFRQALRINPNDPSALNGMGIAQFRSGRQEEGIETVKRAVRIAPRFADAYLNLARWYHDLGRYEESAEAFTEVARIHPKFPGTYFERSLDYLYLGRGEASASDARTFLDLTNWHTDRAGYMIIVAVLGYRRAGNDAAAKQVLELAAKRANTSMWPYPVIKYLRSELSAEELLALATNNDMMTEARAYIGMDLLLKDRKEEALAHFRWVKENGNRAFVEYTLAIAELGRNANNGVPAKP